MLYKPELSETILEFLNRNLGKVELLLTCCQHDPKINHRARVINVCPGCDKRFAKNYHGITTVSLWEVINSMDSFPFPDYSGTTMSIIDACPTRDEERVQDAIRELLHKMKIEITEPEKTRKEATCCGDLYYGSFPTPEVEKFMVEKADEMPGEIIAVHCVSCILAVTVGGKNPRHLADLLFGESTVFKTTDLDEWHDDIAEFIAAH